MLELAHAGKIESRSRAGRLAVLLERKRFALLAVLSLLYFSGTILRAHAKPFWHDELYSIFLARLSFPELWNALAHGADASPPLGYLLLKAVRALLGEGPVAMRLPSMIGFWIFSLCLFRFVHRRLEASYAFAACLLPVATGAYSYAYEARCYGLILGFSGLALVCWQMAAEDRRRSLALCGLACSLAGITCSHYYGAAIYFPLGAAELARVVRRRSLDGGMAAAFLAGLVPLPLCYPLMRSLRRAYSGHPWARPAFSNFFGFYGSEFKSMFFVAVLFLALLGVWILLRGAWPESPGEPPWIPPQEVVLALAFLALPGFVLAAAFLVTHMFTDRYVIVAVAGVILLAVMAVARLARGNAAVGLQLLLATAAAFLFIVGRPHDSDQTAFEIPLVQQAIRQGPVAIDDGLLFFQTWYYLPPAEKHLVYYVTDPASAARFTGQDTIDRNFLAAAPWVHFPVPGYAAIARPGSSLLVFHTTAPYSWLLGRLLHDGANVQVIQSIGSSSLVRAEIPPRP